MKNRKDYKRTSYLVSNIQIKYSGIILLVAFGVAALCAYTIYYTSMMTMGAKLAKVYPQGMLVGIVKTVNTRILINLLLVTPLIGIIGIMASHKIAGPLARIARQLNDIANGDLRSRLILRKSDEIKVLADSINNVIEQFKSNVSDERISIKLLTGDIERLRQEANAEPFEKEKFLHTVKKIEDEIGHLHKKVNKYKI